MQRLNGNRARPATKRAVESIAAAVLCVAVAGAPNLAYAHGGGHGGGGFHGGAVHAGGFHGGGFHHVSHRAVTNVHNRTVANVHNGFGDGRGGHWYHGWHNGRYGWWLWGPGLAWTYYNNQPYCSNPAGYYPYVTQCYTGWSS
jgi:hypothetical protein